MNGITVVAGIIIVIVSYCLVSYPLLKEQGVVENLIARSVKFGTSIAILQIVFQPFFFRVFGGAILAIIVGLVCSFIYVKRVLNISTWKNIAIIVLLPTAALTITAPVLFLFSNIT